MAKSYTHINNDILDGLAKLRISGATFNVLLAIIRYTLSFHRNQHELSNGFLEKATGLSHSSVIRAMQELEERGIIKVVTENCGSHPKMIRIYSTRIATVSNPDPPSVNSDTISSVNSDTKHGISSDTQEIKEEIKENKEKERKPSVFSSIEEANRWYAEHPEELEDDDEE